MDFRQKLNEMINLVDSNLDICLPTEDTYPQTIHKAMRYSIFSGGKRLRPILVMAACEIVGGNSDDAIDFACAIEMVHAYSLIHDDLPAMDNDDYRRGKLTNHKVFGDAMAILAGDALLNFATETMIYSALKNTPKSTKYISAMNEIMSASGINGMISGQVVDIESEGKKIDEYTLNFMHSHKTGALITAGVRAGAIIGGAGSMELECLTEFAKNLGLAFQIKDDILDVIGDEAKLGKKVGSDQINNKSTFVTIYGLEKSQDMVAKVTQEAISALDMFEQRGEFLKDLANHLVNRES